MAYRALKNFGRMWQSWPHGELATVKSGIGGKVDDEWITADSPIRLSHSLNYSGFPVPANFDHLSTVIGGDGLNYAYRARELQKYLNEVHGPPALSHDYPGEGGAVPSDFVGRRGIISFSLPGKGEADGHLDLWNGHETAEQACFEVATHVYLWSVADEPHLFGSVGRDALNHPGDVMTVQHLLQDRGAETGPVDGVCGPRTLAALEAFQRGFLRTATGRVEVTGRTWRELLGVG